MQTTYLNDYNKFIKKGIAFIPLGTLEWHGKHLPIETDFLVAQRICEILSKKISGYVLPPIYLATDRERKKGKRKLIGMDYYLGKKLMGSLYFLKPELLYSTLKSLTHNLSQQGFKKIYIITGHWGSQQVKVLEKLAKNRNIVFVNVGDAMSIDAGHADEYETSLLWACNPEEITRSKKVKLSAQDDIVKFYGYDPREKASLKLGKKLLNEIIQNIIKKIK
ncbi:creatininase family protein [Patescibacteria group bacterium]|nr:creatininase family protein [Patescibacteria group bacterium]